MQQSSDAGSIVTLSIRDINGYTIMGGDGARIGMSVGADMDDRDTHKEFGGSREPAPRHDTASDNPSPSSIDGMGGGDGSATCPSGGRYTCPIRSAGVNQRTDVVTHHGRPCGDADDPATGSDEPLGACEGSVNLRL